MTRRFRQVDVFGATAFAGNPVAVVLDAEGLSEDDLRRISVWTNLSECTFVLPPTDPSADYRVRIFSLATELPFAGHPTLGTARAWLDAGGEPQHPLVVVQECGAGLVQVRREGGSLAFAAPPLRRSGPVDAADLHPALEVLGLTGGDIVDAAWLDNGPGWLGVLLPDAEAVLALTPVAPPGRRVDIGVVAPVVRSTDAAADAPAFEVRAFFTDGTGPLREDPVTGSLNAAAAEWLIGSGRAAASYVARQGTALGRDGRVLISVDDAGIWVGGSTFVAVRGELETP